MKWPGIVYLPLIINNPNLLLKPNDESYSAVQKGTGLILNADASGKGTVFPKLVHKDGLLGLFSPAYSYEGPQRCSRRPVRAIT